MPSLPQFPRIKRTGETKTYGFDLRNEMGTGETISACTFTATVASDSGAADAAPQNIISGNAVVDGQTVTTKIVGGVTGCTYILQAAVQTSTAQVLAERARLLVQDLTA